MNLHKMLFDFRYGKLLLQLCSVNPLLVGCGESLCVSLAHKFHFSVWAFINESQNEACLNK